MIRYLYKAKNQNGKIVTGSVKANNEIEAEKVLSDHNLSTVDLTPLKQSKIGQYFGVRVSAKDKAIFARQLSTMISAGLPLPKAIKIISGQAKKDSLKNIYLDIFKDLEEGYSFSSALAKHSSIFDKVFVSIVAAGETTGKLDIVLEQLASQLESDNNFIGKIRGAMYYPAFILLALVGIGVYMLIAVIPQLQGIFESSGASLPWTTNLLIAMSEFTQNFWYILLTVLIGGVLFLRYWISSKTGSDSIDKLKVHMPPINKLFEGVYMYRFSKVMAMLIGAGVPLLDALKVGSSVMNNEVYETCLLDIIVHVEKGVPLSVQLLKNPEFPALVGQMAAVGEETGELDKVLDKVADYYGETTDQMIKTISTLVEPAVLVIMGLGVAFLVFAVLVPIYNVAQIQ